MSLRAAFSLVILFCVLIGQNGHGKGLDVVLHAINTCVLHQMVKGSRLREELPSPVRLALHDRRIVDSVLSLARRDEAFRVATFYPSPLPSFSFTELQPSWIIETEHIKEVETKQAEAVFSFSHQGTNLFLYPLSSRGKPPSELRNRLAAFRLLELLGVEHPYVGVVEVNGMRGLATREVTPVEAAQTAAFNKMKVLEFLLGNADLSSDNIGSSPSGSISAFDHGHAFATTPFLYDLMGEKLGGRTPGYRLPDKIDSELLQRIESIPESQLEQLLNPVLAEAQIQALLVRRRILLDIGGL